MAELPGVTAEEQRGALDRWYSQALGWGVVYHIVLLCASLGAYRFSEGFHTAPRVALSLAIFVFGSTVYFAEIFARRRKVYRRLDEIEGDIPVVRQTELADLVEFERAAASAAVGGIKFFNGRLAAADSLIPTLLARHKEQLRELARVYEKGAAERREKVQSRSDWYYSAARHADNNLQECRELLVTTFATVLQSRVDRLRQEVQQINRDLKSGRDLVISTFAAVLQPRVDRLQQEAERIDLDLQAGHELWNQKLADWTSRNMQIVGLAGTEGRPRDDPAPRLIRIGTLTVESPSPGDGHAEEQIYRRTDHRDPG